MPPVLSNRFIYWIVAATALGIALQINDGLFDPESLALLLISLWAVAMARYAPRRPVSERIASGALLGGVLVEVAAGFFRAAGGRYRLIEPGPQWPYHAGLAAAAVGAILAFCLPRRSGIAAVCVLLAFSATGVWKIRENPQPFIDVYDFQTDGPQALLHGIDPYTITFRNIYSPSTTVYGPGVATADRLLFGYPYMPLVLYWISPAQWITHDFRYAQVLALALSGVVICCLARGPIGVMAAALLLFSPRVFYVVESGWTEPLSILLLSLIVLARQRESRWTAVFFGLLMASKQYMPMMLLLTPTLLRGNDGRFEMKRAARFIGVAGCVAAFVSAPLILWNLPAFWHSAVTLQLHQPFRDDSLSLLVPVARMWRPSGALAALAFLAATGSGIFSGLGIAPRRAFAGAAAAQFLCFFALNKQAFSNYYALVIGAMVLALLEEFLHERSRSADSTLSDHAPALPTDLPSHLRVAAAGAAGGADADDQDLRF